MLSGPRRGPERGAARSLVIVLHGYGADGADLVGLQQPMAEYLPETAFVAPNAPERCRVNPAGYQWFPIPQIDGASGEDMRLGYERAAKLLAEWIPETVEAEGVGFENTALLGFSQGTMMSLAVGPRFSPALAGIVGFSGRMIDEAALAKAAARPPVLLVHGDRDDVVPHTCMAEADTALKRHGFFVATHTSPGVAHAIAPDGLGLAVAFLVERLGAGGDKAGAGAVQ